MPRDDKLILDHLWLVRIEAHKLAKKLNGEFEEFEAAGAVGLIEAADRFDSSRGAQFKTYAAWRIRGAIIDHFRLQDALPRGERARKLADPLRDTPLHTRVDAPAALARGLALIDTRGYVSIYLDRDTATRLLQTLPERLQKILYKRFVEDKTHDAIGVELGVTEERIWQLQNKALRLLREAAVRLGIEP